MILEVQIQIFGARQSFHFLKIPEGPNINIFCEIWHEASFYIKEQAQKYKFDFLKVVPFWCPIKVCFWFLKKTPPK